MKENKTLIINLFGAAKKDISSKLSIELKKQNINHKVLNNILELLSKTDIIINNNPLLLSIFNNKKNNKFIKYINKSILKINNQFNSLNIFISNKEKDLKDNKIKYNLDTNNIDYYILDNDEDIINNIIRLIYNCL
ncbi:MAG: hypothetical protein SPI06_02095 [Terrisporobacter sp.]|uniref:hypothetical protein n=1 Tax=Terrisporobacter sp. TaxID=1965305 RepID=UPI002A9087CB|nr:hypothetical protein [Terrisporobacter sp.]MDY6152180.1 hypothetical protein [Terrisporobacter sp.]